MYSPCADQLLPLPRFWWNLRQAKDCYACSRELCDKRASTSRAFLFLNLNLNLNLITDFFDTIRPRLTLFPLTLFRLILIRITLFRLTLLRLTLFPLTLFRLTLFRLTLFRLTLFRLPLFLNAFGFNAVSVLRRSIRIAWNRTYWYLLHMCANDTVMHQPKAVH